MLTGIIPAKYRQTVYSIVCLVAIVIGVWQATDGNWKAAIPALVSALVHALSASNVDNTDA